MPGGFISLLIAEDRNRGVAGGQVLGLAADGSGMGTSNALQRFGRLQGLRAVREGATGWAMPSMLNKVEISASCLLGCNPWTLNSRGEGFCG